MYSQSCDDVTLLLANLEEKHKKEKLKQKLKYEKKISANNLIESRLSDISSTIGSELSEEEEVDVANMLEEETQKKKIFGSNFSQMLAKDLKALGNKFENNIIDTRIDIQAEEEAEKSIKKKEEELSKILPNSKLISLLDNKDYEYKIEDNSITINFNSDISKKESDIIISSLLNNYDIDKVQILINKVKKYETTKR